MILWGSCRCLGTGFVIRPHHCCAVRMLSPAPKVKGFIVSHSQLILPTDHSTVDQCAGNSWLQGFGGIGLSGSPIVRSRAKKVRCGMCVCVIDYSSHSSWLFLYQNAMAASVEMTAGLSDRTSSCCSHSVSPWEGKGHCWAVATCFFYIHICM